MTSRPSLIPCVAALLAATLLAVTGCERAGGGTAPVPKVRLQLNWVPEPEFGGIYAALGEGRFAEHGIDVQILKGGPGVPAPQLAASGAVEFAVVAGEQVLTLRDAGGDLVAIFATYQHDPMGIMVHESSPFRTLRELWESTSTVACETNLSFVAMLNERFGGKNLTFVPYSGSVAQFAADAKLAQQCFVYAEPIALELQNVKVRVFPSSESGFDPYNAVIVTRASYLNEHPEIVRAMVTALAEGWTSYLKDPKPTNVHMAALNPAMSERAMDLGAERQVDLVRGSDTEALGLGAMTAERWTTAAEQLKALGKIKRVPRIQDVFRWDARP